MRLTRLLVLCAVVSVAALGCSGNGDSTTESSTTTSSSSAPSEDGYEYGSVTPAGVDIALTPNRQPLELEIGTYYGDSCTRFRGALSATVERTGDSVSIRVGDLVAGTPTNPEIACAQVAQRVSTKVELPEPASADGPVDITVELAGQQNRLRLIGGAQDPRLEAVALTNVTLENR